MASHEAPTTRASRPQPLQAEEAAIAELLAIDADGAVPELPEDVVAAAAALAADGLVPDVPASDVLSASEVEAYLAALRAVDVAAAGGDAAAALEGVRQEVVGKAAPLKPLGNVPVPPLSEDLLKVDATGLESLLGDGTDAEAAAALAAFTADLAELEAISVADYDG